MLELNLVAYFVVGYLAKLHYQSEQRRINDRQGTTSNVYTQDKQLDQDLIPFVRRRIYVEKD
jgi:hypothetical protein